MSAEDPKAFLMTALSALMKSRGFRKDGATWRKHEPEVMAVLNLQKSQWGPSWYVNLGIFFRELDPAEKPRENHCHMRQRLDPLVPEPTRLGALLDFATPIAIDARVGELVWLIQEFALPWLTRRSSLDGARQSFQEAVEPAYVTARARGLLFPAGDV